ncbi:unnamed protein product [[Actinomadura] parvosata subsp. kistnae]|nr:unnamed protein product [Actinomadura parvosata subsp. kistnae]
MAHLSRCASASNTEICIRPLCVGAHASPGGAFRIFRLPKPFPVLAYVPTPADAIYVEGDPADRLELKYDRIRHHTLSPDDSLKLIAAVAQSLADA